jgi:aspartate kinase
MKFGGTSVGDGMRIRGVVNIVKDHLDRGSKVVVVVSALNGVTDTILEVAEQAASGNQDAVDKVVRALAQRHRDAAEAALRNKERRDRTIEKIEGLLAELDRVVVSVSTLKELTARSQDYLLSFGEKLSTTIVHASLVDAGVNAIQFSGEEIGIVTDDHYGDAAPLMKVTAHRVREKLASRLDEGVTPVVTGYIAATQEGITTTLGRGGSDYTATIIGYALDVDAVWIWTDVDGLMTADPQIESAARTIPSISYAEGLELVYFGAKAMHPKALEPAWEKEIPVFIKNTFNPEGMGTCIGTDQLVVSKDVVKAVAMTRDTALITIGGAGMIGTPGVAARVFGILGENHINILMISQGSSEANISIILHKGDLDRAVNLLELAFLGKGMIREVSFEDDVCVVAVVGAGMRGAVGVASRIFGAVAREGVNVRVIAQGSSELNVSFVVSSDDGGKAVRALHQEFKLGRHELSSQP